ncbi:class I SAM-dependent methyltransferase [Salinicoccus hispanicus]|uniref:Methyltransferase domain-containing protein n=1 Tax=Salinicoccus hispanicus TaxID=157225 RepID=A0A6N8U3L6_9STAP|nr:class I SAM-dependent methyltransferase [Salinicoccus hispanicus]MXQ51656.1 methyltransferase domain-containing protein [Salinicoccus hispanicus]
MCKVCQSQTTTFHHPVFGEYHFCPHCEYISKDEHHMVSAEAELKIYDSHNNSTDNTGYVDFLYHFLNDAVFPYVGENKQALDFGSGPVPVLAQLLEQNHNYVVDIYDLFYAPEKVYQGKNYGLITTTEVVEHLAEPMEYFRQFAKLMKPDGVLAVMTLFHPNDMSLFNNWHYIRDRSHVSFYTAKTMHYIAGKAGLKVIHTDGLRHITFMLDN